MTGVVATTVDPAATSRGDQRQWAVETHGLTKRFKDNVAVDEVELLVPRGCAFGYLGPNGAGKTTLIRVLLGLTHADAGTMSLLGHPVPRHRDQALARMGAIVDEPRFHAHLTGRQNLQILAAAREPAARTRIFATPAAVAAIYVVYWPESTSTEPCSSAGMSAVGFSVGLIVTCSPAFWKRPSSWAM